eukprot:CAMPEP_0114559540 /NCGR_PEP_ID=MMETSP0114-20121206/10972_1 /TAXON_ID=31324 /ORGANISM="Goniomonas sp, Strain m" /LENGTH=87 /DNA_ID=CAMNT_0001745009 /DNA_START=34 /DNA_END=297 /DNA_ORIENTATION=+
MSSTTVKEAMKGTASYRKGYIVVSPRGLLARRAGKVDRCPSPAPSPKALDLNQLDRGLSFIAQNDAAREESGFRSPYVQCEGSTGAF